MNVDQMDLNNNQCILLIEYINNIAQYVGVFHYSTLTKYTKKFLKNWKKSYLILTVDDFNNNFKNLKLITK